MFHLHSNLNFKIKVRKNTNCSGVSRRTKLAMNLMLLKMFGYFIYFINKNL